MNTTEYRLHVGPLVCFLAAALSVHAQDLPEDPGTSAPKRTGQYYRADPASQPVKLRQDDLTVVVAARAKLQGSVFEGIGMVGQHGVAGFYSPNAQLTFYVNAPEADDYALSIILASPDVQTMEFKCGDSVIRTPSMGKQWLGSPRNWRQHLPGTLHLKKGVNEITFRLPASTVKPTEKNEQLATHVDQYQFMLYSIELGTPEARQAQLERAKKIKGDSSWMVEGKYGLFIHFSANMYGWKSDTTRSEWFQESVKMFDVEHFADQVERTGAAWVNFTVTHQGFYWPGPSKAVDAVMPGRTTERDLLMEIVDELARRDIDTLFYLHSGYNGVRAGEWRAALGAEYGAADTSRFNDNMIAILRECSLRYGKKIKGFGYIDGCLMHDYPLDPHWESWARAIKAGNPDAVIGFSSNQGPSVSPFSSLSTRDGGHSLAEANPDLMGPGKQYGDVDPAWWCAMDTWCPHKPLKEKWTTGGPKRSTQDYVDYFERMAEKGVPVTINLSMTADVTDDHAIFDPECMAVMEEVREAIRGVAPDQSKQAAIDYAPTKAPPTQASDARLPIDPAAINVVAGNLGDYQSHFNNNFANHMNLWMSAKKPGPCRIKWTLQVPADGVYEVDALAAKGGEMILSCNGRKQGSVKVGRAWTRVGLGSIHLKAGENTLQLDVEAGKGFEFDALELVQPKVKAELLNDALAMRQKPDWFRNAGYGLMFQWTNRATPPKGPIKPWEEKVNDFDLDGFIKMVEESGAAYVLWSVTWGNQYISAPIQSLDAIIKGRTTKRDLLGEMADALHARGIKLIFYYHYGYDCNHSIDADWMKASGGYKADKTDFYKNWVAIVSEIGERYGDKLHGWWFDGGQRYYNCHFDNTPGDKGILSAPFKKLTLAARSGNPKRVVAYNSWIKPRLTEYQDYYGGEGAHVSSGLDKGSFRSGPQQGLLAHGCFIFESKWGHIEKDTPIPKPKFSLDKLTRLVEKAKKEQSPLSINLEMYEDGSVSPDSVALLKQLKSVIRDNRSGIRQNSGHSGTSGEVHYRDGSDLSSVDFTKLKTRSWTTGSFGEGEKTIWDGAKLSGLTLDFTGHNFGYNDSMRKVDFSGSTISTTGNQPFLFVDLTGADFSNATLNITGFNGRMNAFRDAKLSGADFSGIKWAISTAGDTEKTEAFFSGGPGSKSGADKHLAVTFEGADLSRITGPAKAAMIKNLGGFDGKTAIGAKYDQSMLTKSSWTAAELHAAGWQHTQTQEAGNK